jgi:uncharacterized protein
MSQFSKSTVIRAPIERVFAFHLDPANLPRVAPPETKARLVKCTYPSLQPGARVTVRSVQSGIPVQIEAEVVALEAPTLLQDRQIRGPFAHWVHTHRFESLPEGTRLTDSIDYSLPLGPLGGLVMGRTVERDLEATFAYRHEQTRRILEGELSSASQSAESTARGPTPEPAPEPGRWPPPPEPGKREDLA